MTLITLISGQLMPNLFSVVMLKPRKVVLVHTIDSEAEAEFFSEFIKNQKYGVAETELIEVKPFNPVEITHSASEVLRKIAADGVDSEPVVLNYTAGTKPMSIAFYSVFKEAGSRLLYIDTQQETCWWTERDEIKEELLQVKLNIPEVLSLRSGAISGQEQENIIDTLREMTLWIYEQKTMPGNRHSKFQKWLFTCVKLQLELNNANKKSKLEHWKPEITHGPISIEYDSAKAACMLVSFNSTVFPYRKKEFWLNYFTGGWFEHYVFIMLKRSGAYDDIRCNIRLKTNDQKNPLIKNEIDVIAVKNGIPLFVECKTGLVNQKSITNLKAVTEIYGGRYGEAVLVALNPKIDPAILEKMEDYGIHLIGGSNRIENELCSLHEYMVIKK